MTSLIILDLVGFFCVFVLTQLAINVSLRYPLFPISDEDRTAHYQAYIWGAPFSASILYVVIGAVLVLVGIFETGHSTLSAVLEKSRFLAMVHGPLFPLVVIMAVCLGYWMFFLTDLTWKPGHKKVVREESKRIIEPGEVGEPA